MEKSILKSTKKLLNIYDDESFDLDIIIAVNSAFNTLNDLGIGPLEGFMIEDETPEWNDYLNDDLRLQSVKSYIALRVRMLFDPPTNPAQITAIKEQIKELEWRLNVKREGEEWVDPDPVILPPELV